MRKQQQVLKYIITAVMIIVFISATFLFIRWLYWDNSSDITLEAFTDYGQSAAAIHDYSGNVYINIINTAIPAAKVSYETKYGQNLRGFTGSAYSRIFNGMTFDIKDPKTYFSFVFAAFGQYDEESSLQGLSYADDNVPKITNFEEAPEGEIYFSEMDEYKAEEAANAEGLPVEDTIESSEIIGIQDPARLEIEKKLPSILILHTHSTETYTPYINNNYHSINDKENVIQIGNIMTDLLESKYKYNVIHDKTKHDRYSYADSYINSQKTIVSQLEKNPSIKVILDIHRDAMQARNERDKETKKSEYTATINGKKAAKVMFVIGPDNKNFAELQRFAVYVQKKMDKLYPGLFYKTSIKPKGKYNLFYRDHTLLVEVGCTFNTDEEAKYSAELMANVIGEVLKDLEQ